MKKIVRCVLTLFLIMLLVSCSEKEQKILNVYNYNDYMAQELLDQFEKEYDIKINYDTYMTNEELYYKLKQGEFNYDIIFPSDYMVERMIKEDMLSEINIKKLSNIENIGSTFLGLSYDSENKYSVPYLWGTLGIIYNKKMVKENVDSWNILWNEKYKKEILMYDSLRDALGLTLKKLGYSMNTLNIEELEAAKKELINQKSLIKAYVLDEVKDMMIENKAAIAVVYSGEGMLMMKKNPDLAYVIPKEGTNLWFDTIAIPKISKNKKEANLFIDFLLRAKSGKAIVDYIGYSTPNNATYALLDEKTKSVSGAYPDKNTIENSEVFIDLGDFLKEYNRVWTEIKVH